MLFGERDESSRDFSRPFTIATQVRRSNLRTRDMSTITEIHLELRPIIRMHQLVYERVLHVRLRHHVILAN